MTAQNLSNPMTVIGLVNGMIGGIILVMPILALKTGTALIFPVTLVFGFFSYFSCLLCLKHLRNYSDLDEAVLRHFDNKRKYKIFYDVIIIISLSFLLILYFGLICDMWIGMTQQSPLIPILNALFLFPIIYVMKKFHFGASLLAYGILSIIGYCIFLAWMWIEAPQGQNRVPLANSEFIKLGAALAQGFAIQTFFIPILKQNPNRKLYKKLLIVTYFAGTLVYCYIGYSGAQSIVNLVNKSNKAEAEQIGDFFGEKQWQVILLEIIYLVHLYSAYPEFLLIAKKRFFSIFKQVETDDVTFKDVIYVAATIFICLAIRLTSISPELLIELNGSIVSFFFIYVIPIGLHIKCVYFTRPEDRLHKSQSESDLKSPNVKSEKSIEMGNQDSLKNPDLVHRVHIKQTSKIIEEQAQKQPPQVQMDDEIVTNIQEPGEIRQSQPSPATQAAHNCCDIEFRSKAHQICEMVVIVLMVLSGLFTMGYTIFLLAQPSEHTHRP